MLKQDAKEGTEGERNNSKLAQAAVLERICQRARSTSLGLILHPRNRDFRLRSSLEVEDLDKDSNKENYGAPNHHLGMLDILAALDDALDGFNDRVTEQVSIDCEPEANLHAQVDLVRAVGAQEDARVSNEATETESGEQED